jgi:iron complex transport system ATP-binding protein
MITVNDLRFAYKGGAVVLNDVCFGSDEGRCIAVLGNNGAGKSTLVKCLNRILKPHGGKVCVCGSDIGSIKSGEVAKLMSYVAQHSGAERFTVFDSVLLGRKPHIRIEPTDKDLAVVESVIESMGLLDKRLRYVDELSGGERQKVMLARALAQQPRVLLLDEPTSNLDLSNQYEVMDIIRELALREGIIVIIVIHDLNLALRYCDEFLLVHDGTIRFRGGSEVMTSENIREVYGIDVAVENICGIPMVIPMPGAGIRREQYGAACPVPS